MKLIIPSIFLLFFVSCTDNSTPNKENEKITTENELTDLVSQYKTGNESNIIVFENQIDSLKSIISGLKFNDINVIVSADTYNADDLASNFFLISVHEYDTLEILNTDSLHLQNTNTTISRRKIIKNAVTQTERDLESLNSFFTNSTNSYDSDEKKISMFSAISKRIDNYMSLKYIYIIKDYIFLEPKVGYKDFEPGEIVSVIFLYNRETRTIDDQVVVRALNDSYIQFEETGDLEEDQKTLQHKLDVGIKSNYDKEIITILKGRYSLDEEVRVFF